ncbi:MAG: hypothetical protein ACQCN6_05605 [Candidatus Bathyarchaeia archaeon]|jgi:hypothetical protein
MLNVETLEARLGSFPERYMDNFNYVWRRKVKVETQQGASLLNAKFIEETHRRLSLILPRWQTYRPFDNTPCLAILKDSLSKIVTAYDQLNKYSLLDFEDAPAEILETLWHQLGRAKETNGQTNTYGSYSVISVCKPLLLLWGQTLAFDANVRKHLPYKYHIDTYSGNWTLEEWTRVLTLISRDLRQDKKAIEFINNKSIEWYGIEAPVPYGRFLDIYYFEGS